MKIRIEAVVLAFAVSACATSGRRITHPTVEVLSEDSVGVTTSVDTSSQLVVDDVAVDGVRVAFTVVNDATCIDHRDETFESREVQEEVWLASNGEPFSPTSVGGLELALGVVTTGAAAACIGLCNSIQDNDEHTTTSVLVVGLLGTLGLGAIIGGISDLVSGTTSGDRTVVTRRRVDRTSSEPRSCEGAPVKSGTLVYRGLRIDFTPDSSGAANVDLTPFRDEVVPDRVPEIAIATDIGIAPLPLGEAQHAALLAAFAPPIASAPTRPSLRSEIVAALPIEFTGTNSADADALLHVFSASLSEHGLRLVPESSIRAVLRREKARSYDACVDEACQIELGRELAASVVLRTTVTAIDGTCTVAAVPFDLRTQTTLSGATRQTSCRTAAVRDALATIAVTLGE